MANPSQVLYRTLWRWHFYAGLFCIPFVMMLSVTGAIYLFKPQIDSWFDRPYSNLEVQGQRSSPQAQIAAATAALPGSEFALYRVPKADTDAVQIMLNWQGERHLAYVHPYSLRVLKTLTFDDQLIRIVRALHGELKLGSFGAILVELAGCWAIVLIVTGLYLWWPRSASGIAGVLYPRLREGSRKFWRDLHAVTGVWVSLFTLFFLVSGLPWALVWGGLFKDIRSMMVPDHEHGWVVRQEAKPVASPSSNNVHLTAALLDAARGLNFAPPLELSPDKSRPGIWKLSSKHQNRMLRRDAVFSQNGQLLQVKDFSDRPVLDRVIGIGISAHEGHLFGWLNQLLGLLVVLGLILLCVSGFILWRRRKPNNLLGAPLALPNSQVGKVVLMVTLGLALLLPVLAISLVALLILENRVIKKLPGTARWLGFSN